MSKGLMAWLKNYTDEGLFKKANKQQEGWITPTLINGWEAAGDVRYRKNEFGEVELDCRIKNAGVITGVIFNLPVGYRPMNYQYRLVPMVDKLAEVRVSPAGDVILYVTEATNGTWLAIQGFTFPVN